MSLQPKNPNLKEITTPLQKKRGNRQFFDIRHKVSYITYANGYIRREVKVQCRSPYNPSLTYKASDQFVINERKSVTKTCTYRGSYKSKQVILEPSAQKRIDIIDRVSMNYKGYTGRFSRYSYCTLIAK
tara:strand:+ start:871 stop:1257 length:387 start_codon:yes stop_codon:yes gene_type:complete